MESNQPVQQPIPPESTPKQNIPQKTNGFSKMALVIGIIILILLLGIGGYYLGSRNQNTKVVSLPTSAVKPTTQSSTATIDDAKRILTNFQNIIKTHSTISTFNDYKWILKDGSETFIKGYNFSLAVKSYQGDPPPGPGFVDAFGNITSGVDSRGNSYQNPDEVLTAINVLETKSDDFFLQNGFKSNSLNSGEDHNQTMNTGKEFVNNGLSLTKAYEKNGLFCTSSFNQGAYTFASFSCGIVDEAQNELQATIGKELQPLYNPNNDSNIEILVQKVIGDFAVGGVGSKNGPGGAGFYAKKINGVWTNILTTQNGLPCSLAQKYQMPKELSQGCIQGQ